MNQFMEFLNILKEHGLERFNRYYGKYPGIVTSIDDPEKRGRIKVKLPSIFSSTYEHPAFVEMADASGSGKNSANFFPPYVGGYVEVEFEHGDLNFPRYTGGFIVEGNLPSDFTESYGNVRGFVFASGQKIIIDESKGKETLKIINTDGSQMIFDGSSKTAVFTHSSGAGLGIDSSGNVTIMDKSGNENLVLKDGEVSLTTQGQATFSGDASTTVGSSSGITKVQGSLVQLGEGGTPVALVGISQVVGLGNLGLPLTAQIISGSMQVLSS